MAGTYVENAVPTAADDIVFTSTSGNFVIAATLACRSFTQQSGYSGTVSGSAAMNVGDASGGALTLVSTCTWTATGTITFLSSSNNGGAGWGITTAGKTLRSLTFNHASGRWKFLDAVTSGATVTVTAGYLETNGMTSVAVTFSSSGSGVRTLNFSSTSWTVSGTGTSWSTGTVTNLTIVANTATVTATGAGCTISCGVTNYNGTAFVATGSGTVIWAGSSVIGSFTRTGTAAKVDGLTLNANMTCATFTVTGNSVVNRVLVASNTVGTPRTIYTGSFSASNANFMDILWYKIGDTFTRPNSTTTIGSATESGETWFVSGTVGISSNQLYFPGTQNFPWAAVVVADFATLGHADFEMNVDWRQGTAGQFPRFLVRMGDSKSVYLEITSTTQARVAHWNGASEEILASGWNLGVTISTGTTYDVRIVVTGSTLTAYINGSQIGSVTDARITSTGTGNGAGIGTAANADRSAMRFDNFIVSPTSGLDLSGITGGSGDAGGNTNITFTTPVAQSRSGAGGNWSNTGSWTSRVPLPQDNVTVGSGASGTITADMPLLGANLDFTGFTGTLAAGSLVTIANFGNVTLGSGMTVDNTTAASIQLRGRGSHTLTTNGVAIPLGNTSTVQLQVISPGGSYTAQDALTVTVGNSSASGSGVALFAGELDFNDFAVITPLVRSDNTAVARTLTLGSSTVTLNRTSVTTVWNLVATNLTVSAAAGSVVISTATANTRTFAGAGATYGTLTYTVAGSSGALVISDANTFTNLNVAEGRTLTLPAGVTTTVVNWNVSGVDYGYLDMPGDSSNTLTTPDSAGLSFNSDFQVLIHCALDDWSPGGGTIKMLVSRMPTDGNSAWQFNLYDTGVLILQITPDGTWASIASAATYDFDTSSFVNISAVNGEFLWMKAEWRKSDGRTRFFAAPSSENIPFGSQWTQIGDDYIAAAGSIFNASSAMSIFSQNAGQFNNTDGKLKRVIIRNNLVDDQSGAVFDVDVENKPVGANTMADSISGAVVTITGTTAQMSDGRTVVNSSTAGTAATLSSSSPLSSESIRLQDSAASGSTPFNAYDSTNVSGNTNWNFWNRVSNRTPLHWSDRKTVAKHVVTPRLVLDGTIGTYASVPDADQYDLATNLDLRVKVAWDAAVDEEGLIGKWRAISGGRSYLFTRLATGTLRLYMSSGGDSADVVSTASTEVAPTGEVWLMVTRNESTDKVRFYTAPGTLDDPVFDDFELLGTERTIAYGTLHVSPSVVSVGAWSNGVDGMLSGSVKRAQIRNDIDGDVVLDIDFTEAAPGATTFLENSSYAATVTLNGNARIAGGLSWSVRSLVSETSELLWNDRSLVSDTSELRWNTRALAFDETGLRWNDRTLVSDLNVLQWEVRELVSDTTQFLWNARALVADLNDLRWNARGIVSDITQLVWGVRTLVSDENVLRWNTRALVSEATQLLWNARVVVSDITDIRWAARALVSDELGVLWAVRVLVTDEHVLRWDVRVPVSDETSLLWNARGIVSDTVDLRWNARALVVKLTDVRWDVRLLVFTEDSFLWNVRALVSDTTVLLWSARGMVSDDTALLWAARALVSDDVTLRWNVRQLVGELASLLWNVRQVVSNETDLRWDARGVVSETTALLWDARALTSQQTSLLWGVRVLVSDENTLRWHVRQLVSNTTTLRWNVTGIVSAELGLRWDVRVPVSVMRSLLWNTRQRVGDETVLRWNVFGGVDLVSVELGLRWNVRALVTKATTPRWNVRALVSDETTLRWAARTTVSDTIDLRWANRTVVSETTTLFWSAKALVANVTTLRWTTLQGRSFPSAETYSVQQGFVVVSEVVQGFVQTKEVQQGFAQGGSLSQGFARARAEALGFVETEED